MVVEYTVFITGKESIDSPSTVGAICYRPKKYFIGNLLRLSLSLDLLIYVKLKTDKNHLLLSAVILVEGIRIKITRYNIINF